MDWKTALKKTWYFIWEDNSVWSWIINVILAFIIIKFLVYPGLGWAFNSSHPIVAVVSGSMEHEGSFDDWWLSEAKCSGSKCTQEKWYTDHDISKEQFRDYRFRNGFNKGDIMILYGTEAKDLKKGDVIVFRSKKADPIIHRIIEVKQNEGDLTFQTKGDNNANMISNKDLDETSINDENIIGKAVLRVPFLGWIKISFVCVIRGFTGEENFFGCMVSG